MKSIYGISASWLFTLMTFLLALGTSPLLAHESDSKLSSNVVQIGDRLNPKRQSVEHPLVCAQLLLGRTSPLTQLEISHTIMRLYLPLKARLRTTLKKHLRNASVQEFMQIFTQNASRLAAVMNTIPQGEAGDRTPQYNSLRALMELHLYIFVNAVEARDLMKVGNPKQTLKELILHQKHISVLADLVEELEASLPKDFLVYVISEELAAFLLQGSVSPLHFDDQLFLEPKPSNLVLEFYFEQFNYRMSPILECAGLGAARDQAVCRAFAPIRNEFEQFKKRMMRENRMLTSYQPSAALNEIGDGVTKAATLGLITERIFLWAYNYDDKGNFGNGDSRLMHPLTRWMQLTGEKLTALLNHHWALDGEKIRKELKPIDGFYNDMLPAALRTYAMVRLLQGPSYINRLGIMVHQGERPLPVKVAKDAADRTVLPYFKALESALK